MLKPQRAITLAYLRRTPSAGLLVVQLAGVVLYPWMETSPQGRALFTAFGLVVLGVALHVVRRSPWLTWLALVLAVLVVALSAIAAIVPHPGLAIATAILEAAFYFYAAGSLIAYMLQDWVATTDELFAAGATFTLLAWAFAYVYVACQAIMPGSFSAPLDPQAPRTWMELLFLSVSVLSSVGLSDILPVTPMARALVTLGNAIGRPPAPENQLSAQPGSWRGYADRTDGTDETDRSRPVRVHRRGSERNRGTSYQNAERPDPRQFPPFRSVPAPATLCARGMIRSIRQIR